MAGHSKFKNIMHRKGAQDKKRSATVFEAQPRNHRRGEDGPARSRHERAPPRRRQRRQGAVDAQGQYPAVDRQGIGGDAENYEEIRYEGFGPGGVALIVEALTDNRNRTATNVRTAFSKNGGNLGASGSVSHGFERMGLIEYGAAAGDADKVLEAAIDAGAEDVRVRRGRPPDLDHGRLAPRSRQVARGRPWRGGSGQARLEARHPSRSARRRCRPR